AKLRHDLRTPINAVKGYGEMIVEDARDGGHLSLLPDLQKLLEAADGMLDRIDGLVAFSGDTSFEQGQAEPSFAESERDLDALRPSHAANAQRQIAGQLLVVDDTAANRVQLARQLSRDGHAVEVAASGMEALDIVTNRNFELMLLDVLMPEMSGYEVL